MLKLQGKAKGGGDSKQKTNTCVLDKNLGFPVGLTQGTYNQNEMHVATSLSTSLSLASYWYAYAFSYIKSPVMWTTKDINNILVAGKSLIPVVGQIYDNSTDTDQGPQIFIQDYCIELEIPKQAEVIGNIYNLNRPQVNNIHKGLKKFFRRPNRACLFRCNAVQLVVWKSTGAFFVFDSRGRNETCCLDDDKGLASLICLESLKNVACLISTLSNLQPEEFYVLNEVRVKNMIRADKVQLNVNPLPIKLKDDEGSYNILSEKMAILNGSFNIANQCFKETRNFQTLTTCCCAFVYSLIRPPNTWTSKSVDKVLLFGSQLYDGCVQQELPEQFSIRNIPPMINIATYRATIRIHPYQNGGRMLYAIDFTTSELMKTLSAYLLDHTCVLLQVDQLYFTIWKREQVFYLFDPYARNKTGETILGKDGAACVHMHSTLGSLCAILYANLMRIAEKERFYLHGLESSLLTESGEINDEERMSVNESVGSLFTPQIKCIGPNAEKFVCNLDSPSVSVTQFIRPWHMMKGAAFEQEAVNASGSDSSLSLSTESEFSFASDNSQNPNNQLGLEDDVYDELRQIGLTDDEIAAYQAMGITPKDMKKWAALGVTPDDVKRLRDADITLDEFKAMQKMGLTVDDCIKTKELKIPPKQYAKMKKLGVAPEDMIVFLANKENISKFRKLSLNQCEIDKLSAVGVTAVVYEDAHNKGLSFEEVIYANQNDIPVDEFARQKSMELTPVDIIKAKEMNMTPEEYKKMKDDEEMAKIKCLSGDPETIDEVVAENDQAKPATPEVTQNEEGTAVAPVAEKPLEPNTVKQADLPQTADNSQSTPSKDAPIAAVDGSKSTPSKDTHISAVDGNKDTPISAVDGNKSSQSKDAPNPSSDDGKSIPSKDASIPAVDDNNSIPSEPNLIGGNLEKNIQAPTREGQDGYIDTDSDAEGMEIPGAEPNLIDKKPSVAIQPVWMTDRLKPIGVKRNMAVIKSSTLSPRSFQKLFTESFKLVDRVLVLNQDNEPNCVAFRNMQGPPPPDQQYFLYEGCACNMDQIRRLDIASSKRYLMRYPTMNTMIARIIERLSPPEPKMPVTEKRAVAHYAREMLDDKLNLINQQFNTLLNDFHNLSLKK